MKRREKEPKEVKELNKNRTTGHVGDNGGVTMVSGMRKNDNDTTIVRMGHRGLAMEGTIFSGFL